MSAALPALRRDLDFMPSPVEDRPGLLIRDSFHYSEAVLIIPPALVECLACFDGQQTDLDLRGALVRITGELQVGDLAAHLTETLAGSGFLEDDNFAYMREERQRAFRESPVRQPAHAGSGYPDDAAELRGTLDQWMGGEREEASERKLLGIAAPHVSPSGGYESYRAAYRLLEPSLKDRTFAILGTSHYGAPDRFGLTRKPFATPFGTARTDRALVDELTKAAPSAVVTEDYCHAVEHSIEFQVVFLQSLFGPDVRILPILCGSFANSIYKGGRPEDNEDVKRFLGALGEMAAREADRLFWILGIDMAHMGRRYGDDFTALAGQDEMERTGARDMERLDRVASGDRAGFWDLVQHNQDDLKWCGSSPLYTFLSVCPGVRGAVEKYEQWNIDPQSVVSFAGLSFC